MSLAGINDILACRNLSGDNMPCVLICSVNVWIGFSSWRDHQEWVFVLFLPARPTRRCRLLGAQPNIEPVELISDSRSFLAVSSGFLIFPPIAPVMDKPSTAIFLPPCARTHRQRTSAPAQRSVTQSKPCPHNSLVVSSHMMDANEFLFGKPVRRCYAIDGVILAPLYSGPACRGFRPAPARQAGFGLRPKRPAVPAISVTPR